MTSGTHGTRGYVLVADDNVAARIQISSILEDSGFTVFQAENGQQACAALQGQVFDIAMLDVAMPDVDGPEIVPVAQNVAVPVVGLSPASQGGDRWADAGVDHVVEKPVNRDVLLAMMDRVLTGDPEIPPVDLQHLAQYTAGDKSIERELAGLFTTSSARYLKSMSENGPGKDWRIAAHSLKGSAKGIGAARVAVIAETAENATDQISGDHRRSMLTELQAAVAEVERFFADYLKE